MNKYLFGALAGVIVLIGLNAINKNAPKGDEVSVAAQSFKHPDPFLTMVGSGIDGRTPTVDNCSTPEDIAALRQGKYEKIVSYSSPDDVLKIKLGVITLFPDTKLTDMTWVQIDAYRFIGADGKEQVMTSLFYKVGDQICAEAGGAGPIEDWNNIVKAAGLNPASTDLSLGYEPKTDVAENVTPLADKDVYSKIDEMVKTIRQSIDTTAAFG